MFFSKTVIVFFFGNQISKWRWFKKKKAILTYFLHFLITREKTPAHISPSIYNHKANRFIVSKRERWVVLAGKLVLGMRGVLNLWFMLEALETRHVLVFVISDQ